MELKKDEVVYKWVKVSDEKPIGQNKKSLNIRYKSNPELLLYLDDVWCWAGNSFEESKSSPVKEESWSAIEWLKEIKPVPQSLSVISNYMLYKRVILKDDGSDTPNKIPDEWIFAEPVGWLQPVPQSIPISEWQLCPKCNGTGRIYSDLNVTTTPFQNCDVCNGAKVLQKPLQSLPISNVENELILPSREDIITKVDNLLSNSVQNQMFNIGYKDGFMMGATYVKSQARINIEKSVSGNVDEAAGKVNLFPSTSEWINEFKENWYKDNDIGILSKNEIKELWDTTERACGMAYKYQREAFEKKFKEWYASQLNKNEK